MFSKTITPVGGLLSQLAPQTENEIETKVKVNNKKLSELLYLPGADTQHKKIKFQYFQENHEYCGFWPSRHKSKRTNGRNLRIFSDNPKKISLSEQNGNFSKLL
jgi:hypothetical protein